VNVEPCKVCGLPLEVGQQGCIKTIRPHEPVLTYHPFIPYFDIGLGVQVNSFAERWTAMRRAGLQYRDLPSAGDLSARRDRIEERRKEEARG
jgi:hypothetical protein